MKKWLRQYWLLAIIAILAFTLRVYKVGEYPVGMTWDEPALGYNAYSILKTGRDEYGKWFPITFKSFGDFKPGFFIYLLVPFVALFGLNKFAIRFPSTLIGTGAVVAIFFLTKEIMGPKKSRLWPYLSAFLLALSPWNIHFSRGAWEANLALMTIVLSIYFFLKLLRTKQKKFLIISAIFLAISVYTYHGAKVFLICFLSALTLFRWQEFKKLPKDSKKLALVLGLLLLIPLFASFRGSANRARVMSVFSYPRPTETVEEIISHDESLPRLNYLLFHSEPLNMARGVMGRYFNHLTGRFLFFQGDWSSPRHSVPYMGMMYLIEIPFLLLGIGHFLASKENRQRNILFTWLLVGPIPAAVTRDIIHAIRSYWTLIPLIIITAAGIDLFLSWCRQRGRNVLKAASVGLVLGYLFCLSLYLDIYYCHFAKINSAGWNYGMDRVAEIIEQSKDKYDKIVVTQKYGQPYMFYLFYTRYDPWLYQPQAFLKEDLQGDVGVVEKLDNIEFLSIYWPEDRGRRETLFIGQPDELPLHDIRPDQARLLEEIKFLDGRVAYRVVETL